MNRQYIFLSHTLSESTPTYGNRDSLTIKSNSSISDGATANSFSLNFSTNHIGTHIDLPYHFYEEGKNIQDMEADYWIYKNIEIIDIPSREGQIIEARDLSSFNLDEDLEILLIRTGFENYRGTHKYWENNPGISPNVADYLREKYFKFRTIGFDFISLTSFQNRALGKEAHKNFLNENNGFISIIEDMKLAKCPPKIEELIVSPLCCEKIDSAPVTIIGRF